MDTPAIFTVETLIQELQTLPPRTNIGVSVTTPAGPVYAAASSTRWIQTTNEVGVVFIGDASV